MFSLAVPILAVLGAINHARCETDNTKHAAIVVPSQSVFVDQLAHVVLPANSSLWREDAFSTAHNPTEEPAPFFQIFDPSFLSVLGPSPSIQVVSEDLEYAFAHEGPIWVAEHDEVVFCSNAGGTLGRSDRDNNNAVFKLSMTGVELALAKGEPNVNVKPTLMSLHEDIQMTNGGTGLYYSDLLLINSGRGKRAPSIARVNSSPPYNSTTILNNYYGRQFNSLNDVKIHPSGKLFFTDVAYGYLLNFREQPQLPNQVYRFDPVTGAVRVVADGFLRCNGIAFSQDGQTAYVSDTGAAGGLLLGLDQTEPSSIYAFDVHPSTHAFSNRRIFAFIEAGVPDGIQVDTQGNVYSGCGDGVHVWNSEGTLIGKLFTGKSTANMVFAGPGRMVLLVETQVFVAHIKAEGIRLSYP